MEVTAVITRRTTIRGLDISIISLNPNSLYAIPKPFNFFVYVIHNVSKGISISALPASLNE
jgi:hypothetical protein